MTRPRRILVPTDFSESAELALAFAESVGAAWGATLHLLHVYSVPAFPDGLGIGIDVVTPIAQAAEAAMRTALAKHPALSEHASVQLGDPREVIVRVAKELPADLVVLGSHGRRGLARVLLGSVAEEVVRLAPCPVLVVPQAPTEGAA